MSAALGEERAAASRAGGMTEAAARRTLRVNAAGVVITILTLIAAIIWAFPLYWAIVTTLKPEFEVVEPGVRLWPKTFTVEAYGYVLTHTSIGLWYLNSLVTSGAVALLVIVMGAACGYAISQLRFPGRTLLWFMILASFMVPIQTLIVTHFILMSDFFPR